MHLILSPLCALQRNPASSLILVGLRTREDGLLSLCVCVCVQHAQEVVLIGICVLLQGVYVCVYNINICTHIHTHMLCMCAY